MLQDPGRLLQNNKVKIIKTHNTMTYIKIDKRFEEELAGIRKIAKQHLPLGARNAVLNKCAKLSRYSQKAAAQLQRGQYRHAAYDARTQEDMAAQARAKKAVLAALMGGQRIDLTRAAEFHVSQMHTTISQIRRDIEQKDLPFTLCDEWVRPGDTRPFKRYWFIPKEGEKND